MDEYDEAVKYLNDNGWEIKLSPGANRFYCAFPQKTIFTSITTRFGDAGYKSVIIHEAHHASTCLERHRLNPWENTWKEIYEWIINDEVEAFTKQYNYLAKFLPQIKPMISSLIRAQLSFYKIYEARESANFVYSFLRYEQDTYRAKLNEDYYKVFGVLPFS
jgi:hypothetical protein